MKRTIVFVASAVLLITLGVYSFFIAPSNDELEAVRNMTIENINMEEINDGVYRGSFAYGSYTYEVEVNIKDHRIGKIDVISNRDTEHAKKAESVISRILEKQSLDVDVVSGATTTSKALLKAIENALNTSPVE
ncbi:MAG: hypothetical protein APF77_15145 [Clostridia bacterium BRH_c25]|nr:MAG: hypothetical protein APF77_15145 [Clostridia bacterium BRH_c25]